MALDIPLPTAFPQDDPLQYIPLVLSAIEGFLLARDVWEDADYPEAYNYMQELMDYLVDLMEGNAVNVPVGSTMIWHMVTPPDRWLICDGSGVLIADYPELYALIGGKYGEGGGFFGLPSMGSRSPMGAGATVALDANAGTATHTLSIAEMPAHTHAPLSPNTSFLGNRPSGSSTTSGGSSLGAVLTTSSVGGGAAHNNLSPVFGVNFIIYGGKAP
jgi:microcystin-dependent protein